MPYLNVNGQEVWVDEIPSGFTADQVVSALAAGIPVERLTTVNGRPAVRTTGAAARSFDAALARAQRNIQNVLSNPSAYTPDQVAAARAGIDPATYNPESPFRNIPIQPLVGGGPEPLEAEGINFRERAALLFPFLPADALDTFAASWAEYNDPELAMAALRQDTRYATWFPGNKRPDGTVRLSEIEYVSTMEGYRRLVVDFGLNPSVFQDKFPQLLEGDVSVSEFSGRLTAAYEQIVTSIPQVREFYTTAYGIPMTDEAVFASFIDPDIGEAILNRRISASQIGGEAFRAGFRVDLGYAERLASAGLDAQNARSLFGTAAQQLPTLGRLARRYSDIDQTFDLEEFTEAEVFGEPTQTRRIRRLRAAESSAFTPREGTVATTEDFAARGLRQR